ncbi:MAG: hypothetical protein MAG715_00444 [Methanonatronarchaeales archaeon]|nr:hypothetical protein [Methanonatronarchaeales archaeon]
MDARELADTLGLPPEVTVLIIAATPVFELRGAIPVAIGHYALSPLRAYSLGVLGNLIPVVPLLLFLESGSGLLRRRSRFFDRFFSWLFERTHRNHSERFDRYGALALLPFVAVPLPVTGAWTGCAAAFVFGVSFRYAFPAIALGVALAGVVVTAVSVGGQVLLF